MVQSYLGAVEQVSKMARDPSATGVAAVMTASDMLKERGADAAINFFNDVLPQVKNEAVQRAIRMQLIDLYKRAGQQDKALEQVKTLITSAPAGPGESAPPSR